MSGPEVTITPLSGTAGQPVVLLGPSIGTSVHRLWHTVAGRLDGYRVVGWDLPGHGHSAPAVQPFTTAELAAAVLEAVDTELGSAEVLRYAGDSYGGCVGLQLVLDHPDRFAAAAILCSGAKIATAQVWRDRIDLVRREGMAPVQAGSPQRWFGARVAAQPNEESRAVLEELMDVDAHSYSLVCEALRDFDVRDRLADIRVPVLAIAGADDLVTTPEQHREMADAIPGGRCEVLTGVGHLAPLEDPAATASLVQAHFDRAADGPSGRSSS